jgi:hypothetical protein
MEYLYCEKIIMTIAGSVIKEERELLGDIPRKGKHDAQKRKRAQALLLADEGLTDSMIAELDLTLNMCW